MKTHSDKLFYSQKFHRASEIKKLSAADENTDNWPDSWKTIHYKTYPRMPKIQFDNDLSLPNYLIGPSLLNRASQRDFSPNQEIDFKTIQRLLYFSAGQFFGKNAVGNRRFYPSAGARYPLEIYLFPNRVSSLLPGIYHYNIKENNLEVLLEYSDINKELIYSTGQQFVENAGCLIAISGIFIRSQIKYGERGYRFALIEAGHVGQNIYLLSTVLRLKCCAIGGFNDNRLNRLLDFDTDYESTIYLFALGK